MTPRLDIHGNIGWLARLDEVPVARVVHALWAVSLVAGAIQAFLTRYAITPDGLSYIDIGETYWSGAWKAALVSYWSPLYSWFVGASLKLLRPSPAAEYSVIHLLNFLIFCASLVSFHFFIKTAYTWAERSASDSGQTFPEWAWYVIGYSLFLWCSLAMMSVAQITPELLLSSFLFIASGLLIRIRIGDDRLRTYAALGGVLAFGYLAKAYVLVLSAVIIAVAVLLARGIRRGIAGAAVAVLALGVIAGPYIVALSQKMGRITATDSGKFIYCWHINHKPWQHWQGPGATHPTRQIFTSPAVYEFATPIAGHYPPWYDPGYWLDGMKPEINLKSQARLAVRFAWEYFEIIWSLGAVLAAIFILHLYNGDLRGALRRTWAQWFLFVPALASLGIFGTLNVEARYIAVAMLLLWMGLLLGVQVPRTSVGRALLNISAVVMAAFVAARLAHVTFVYAHEAMSGNVPAQVAGALHASGVPAGSDIAIINVSNNYPWARPAQIRLVSEIPPGEADTFWASGDAVRQDVYRALRRTGAVAAIAPSVPVPCRRDGWQSAGQSGFWVLRLPTLP